MMETSARLLRLLSLLQTRREWSGPALAAKLNVSARTIRTDIDRLRSLGYDVGAVPGVGGGYRLRSGVVSPPLFLDPDEAVAVAVGLRTAAYASVSGIAAHAVGALDKLERLLPGALQQQMQALHTAIVADASCGAHAQVDADVLRVLAAACGGTREVVLQYRDHRAQVTRRCVEPLRLVLSARRWYLVAWDLDREDWRTFRADRISRAQQRQRRFTPRPPPAADLAGYVAARVGSAMWRHRATLRVYAPAAVITAKVPPAVQVEPVDATTCMVRVGSDSWEKLSLYIGMLGADFTVVEPAELVGHLADLAALYARAVAGDPGSTVAVPD